MKNRFVHFGVVLLVIAAISAGILGLVNDFTKTVIAANNEKAENEAKKQVLTAASIFKNEEATTVEDLQFVPGYDEAGNKVGYVVAVNQAGYAGNISCMLGIDMEGKVAGVRIIGQSETPGLGAKIADVTWQDHWIGKDSSYQFNKSVDAFAGATISPTAVYTGIMRALKACEHEVNK